MIRHIKFIGDNGQCAKWLPFAKKQYKTLSKLYSGRSTWTWERVIPGGVWIRLSHHGGTGHIKIRATLFGYEFSTALAGTVHDGQPATGFVVWLIAGHFSQNDPYEISKGGDVQWRKLTDIKFTLVRPFVTPESDPPEKRLEGRNRSGKKITFAIDALIDQRDRYLYAGDWPERLSLSTDAVEPRLDWFTVPLPETPEEAQEWAFNGYHGGAKVVTSPTFRRRHMDRAQVEIHKHTLEEDNPGVPIVDENDDPLPADFYLYPAEIQAALWHQGVPIIHSGSGGTFIHDLLMHHVDPLPNFEYWNPNIGAGPINLADSRSSNAALYNSTWLLATSISGEDYKFGLWERDRKVATNLDFSGHKPSWIDGDGTAGPVYSKWYWRGDGRRCMSIQYGLTERIIRDDPIRPHEHVTFVPPGTTKGQDVGLVELEWTITPSQAAPPDVPDVEIAHSLNVHSINTRAVPVFPIALDYDLFDGNIRRIIVLEPWIGNPYRDLYEAGGATFYGTRPILIYAHFCTLNDLGEVSTPEYSVPLLHEPWLEITDDPYAQPNSVPWAYHPQIQDEYGYWVARFWPGSERNYNSQAFIGRWNYRALGTIITSMDARVQGMTLKTRISQPTWAEHTYCKRWRIWGEEDYREYQWFDRDANAITPSVDPLATLVTPQGVATPPNNYVRFAPGHALWRYEIVDGPLARAMRHMVDAKIYFEDNNPFKDMKFDAAEYTNGFRVHPNRNFAVFVQNWTAFYDDDLPNDVQAKLAIDHIEYFHGYETDEEGVLIEPPVPIVTVGTHVETYNLPRETSVLVGGPGTVSNEGNVVIANNGIWVK